MSAQGADGARRDAEVARYLRENPSFFERHAALLESLELGRVRDAEDGGVRIPSLIEKQVALLRGKNGELKERLDALIETARANENLGIGLHRLSLRLMDADTPREVAAVARAELRRRLPGNQVVIRLVRRYDAQDGLGDDGGDARVVRLLRALAAAGKPDCGPFDDPIKLSLFGHFARRVASAVVAPLAGGDDCFGLLALGSADGDSFRAGKGTMFLVQYGELIGCALKACARREGLVA